MRMRNAILIVVLAVVLSVLSHRILANDLLADQWLITVVSVWMAVTGAALAALLWFYLQILKGPQATVPERLVVRLEHAVQRAKDSRLFRRRRLQRLSSRADKLAQRIDPKLEADVVRARRTRLSTGVIALITVLSISFWDFAALAPLVLPNEGAWFIDLDRNVVETQDVDLVKATLFSVDQITRGTLFDVFEVFDINFSKLENNPNNAVFSWLIVGYRILVGGALLLAIFVHLGMREDWASKAVRDFAEDIKKRLTKLGAEATA